MTLVQGVMMQRKGALRFGIAVPQIFPTGDIDPKYISNYISTVEALGYDSLWVQEQILGSACTLDTVTLLSYAAALTTRVKLGTAVLLTALRNPFLLAKSLATLDRLCQGRLFVGVGLGGNMREYSAFNIPSASRASRFEEGLVLMKRLWTEDKVTFQGRFWQMDGVSLNPKPVQKPHPPLWFGGRARPALKRAVRLGDGWMGAGSSPPKSFKREIELVRQCVEEEGRDPAGFPLSKRIYIAVERDKKLATERLGAWFGHYYGNPARALELSVFGSEEECIEQLSEITETGIELLLLNPVYNMLEQAERLAQGVMPKL